MHNTVDPSRTQGPHTGAEVQALDEITPRPLGLNQRQPVIEALSRTA